MSQPRVSHTTQPPEGIADAAAAHAAERRRRLHAAWGRYLHEFAWDHFATLTFARPASLAQIRREFESGFVRRVAFQARQPIAWFFAVERGAAGGRLHLHALLANTRDVRASALQAAWTQGNALVERYDPMRNATGYITKSLASDGADEEFDLEYDFSRRIPQRARAAA